ncbi:hypothetical protein HME9302_02001 [Alteripontixanthobacter maritimus]|uniref:Smr domain-containing protein n=1 Tax=Alteripontixanthobacter maritimus TaxID=2161824 RepID=A0A369QB55_9SPHN|nr:Smr/MutS family protein [Alteripontixanthobacter maritimus]RDC60785.1 hypothetical protein HME9302_02001 [Alteripontixanthobacter maritimus]
MIQQRRTPRGLTDDEARAWEALADTVAPLDPTDFTQITRAKRGADPKANIVKPAPAPTPAPAKPTASQPPRLDRQAFNAAMEAHRSAPAPAREAPVRVTRPRAPSGGSLDGHWDRRLKAGDVAPDFSLDLHGHGLDAAYHRLMDGMAQAQAMGARVVLVVTGKERPVDAADRGTKRGAIRAKIFDWLAASEHGGSIAAIRKAHRRHGGDGALYLVLRR